MTNPFGARADMRAYAQQCYGGYCNMCRDRDIKPVPYHEFADLINHGMKTKQAFRHLHLTNA
jgi:hypothetical protein